MPPDPVAEPLTMYGRPADVPPLGWAWVSERLEEAGAYWVLAAGHDPHPRPVWGVWEAPLLHLSIGSPVLAGRLAAGCTVTVHLDGVEDVVILDGVVRGPTERDDVLATYVAKYDRPYTVDQYGPLTTIDPHVVVAWRSAGWAGRDGFRQAGRWRYGPPASPSGRF